MNERKQIKSLLDEELSTVRFKKKEDVLKRTHPKTFKQKWEAWLNEEISVPVIPTTSFTVLLLAVGIFTMLETNPETTNHIVEFGGNLYYQHVLDERGVSYER
ncbi:hypothetical protein [Bacillus sp. FJAT-45037]|uniref:hypothetical protein n=1 Tax=Bacillus sp. FJAT-45037 TaxID=2011007 RepID=UPI000C2386AF|nr:hypothetical protein [Bacillus sp. FJAT-45037]